MDVIADNNGNVYFTDGSSTNYSIRKVDANGIISRFAGNNTAGYSGDGGPATAAAINNPWGLAFDISGNMLISDVSNRVIRKVSTNGTISTIAGIAGSYGFSGDGGPATSAQLGAPAGLCTDASGNIYIADPGKHVIRKIAPNGIISTIAGIGGSNGYNGNGGPATAALLNSPYDVCIDAAGNLYVADKGNHAIRKISTSGIISTVAGIGGSLNYGFTGDGGNATSAKLNNPQSVSVDVAGNLYFSDYTNNRIRKVNAAGIISTIGGNGQSAVLGDGPDFYGGDYGVATSASIGAPYGNFWINNILYIASSNRIRKITF
jgi:sugar lactone lactonase YvrE